MTSPFATLPSAAIDAVALAAVAAQLGIDEESITKRRRFLQRLALLLRDELNVTLRAARDAGWDGDDLSAALGVSRERVRQRIVASYATSAEDAQPAIAVPAPPDRLLERYRVTVPLIVLLRRQDYPMKSIGDVVEMNKVMVRCLLESCGDVAEQPVRGDWWRSPPRLPLRSSRTSSPTRT